jgi:hypothetical protein
LDIPNIFFFLHFVILFITDCQYILITGGTLIFILWILTLLGKKLEPFESNYISRPDVLLTSPVHLKLSSANYGDLKRYIPSTPMASYAQVTNNKKIWMNPENGSAPFPEINGTSFYKS